MQLRSGTIIYPKHFITLVLLSWNAINDAAIYDLNDPRILYVQEIDLTYEDTKNEADFIISSEWNVEIWNKSDEKDFNYELLANVEESLHQKYSKSWRSLNDYYFVPQPKFPCTNDSDCGTFLICQYGYCSCPGESCWIYQYDPNTFIPRYTYSCGNCGELGSECKATDASSCDPPGHCYIDNFCHCLRGEHEGPDICVITDIKKILILFLGGFVVFAILGFTVLMYTCFLNYRRTRTVFWCREYRRRRRNVPERVNPANGLVKTPAFTIEGLYQFGADPSLDGSKSDNVEIVNSGASSSNIVNRNIAQRELSALNLRETLVTANSQSEFNSDGLSQEHKKNRNRKSSIISSSTVSQILETSSTDSSSNLEMSHL